MPDALNLLNIGIMNIIFRKASLKDKDIIFSWLDKPHVKEFWDNSQEHRKDILNFLNGRIEPAPYFSGIFSYWIGDIKTDPFSFLLTSEILPDQSNLNELWKKHISKKGKTFSIDFCIGNKKYLGKGLAASTLVAFIKDFQKNIDPAADTFFIDPDINNLKAKYVYEKAGFNLVGNFIMPEGVFKEHTSCLLVKKL